MLTDDPHIIISAKSRGSTGKAILLERLSDSETFWVPKSCCEWQGPDRYAIAKWFADKEGIE